MPSAFDDSPLREPSAASTQAVQFQRAIQSLRSVLNQYTQALKSPAARSPAFRNAVQQECKRLSATLEKLDQRLIRIAAFGLVSRGKSSVLNALMGEKILQTGPINGVTQWPRSVRWLPNKEKSKIQIELIDTPGLDEVDGQTRAQMANEIAREADLILFITAGDLTRTEYQALRDLCEAHKPILLVFNKMDLYPDRDRQLICDRLQAMFAQEADGTAVAQLISNREVVMVSAEPAPRQVRIEWPDGRVTHEWESLPPEIEPLRVALLDVLNREGQALLALNAMLQTRQSTVNVTQTALANQQAEAEALIWRFAQVKAITVGLNPIAIFDLVGGFVADLALIRALARLYGLPMTGYRAAQLWRTILLNSGGLLLSEWGSGLLLGMGKSAAISGAMSQGDASSGWLAQATAMGVQGAVAGYGSYAIGKVAQTYLEQGCTWGPSGPDTLIKDILSRCDRNAILYRLRQDLKSS
jgi:uncharacterized protein